MRYLLMASALIAVGLGGCSLLPSGSPTAREFETNAQGDGDPGFVRIDLDLDLAKAISGSRKGGLSSLGGVGGYQPSLVLRPGDVISTTIYEVAPIPLFGSTRDLQVGSSGKSQEVGGHVATIPTVTVEQDGTVPVPFSGAVKVAGLTPTQAGAAIAKALQGKATNPQAVVSLVSSSLNAATVNGDVNKPAIVPLTLRGERVLDVLASAGGAKFPIYDEDIQMIRNGRVATANLQQLVVDPTQNVRVKPGDSIVVVHNPRSFAVLGSALKVSQFDFNVESVTLAEAIARSGGLIDAVANVGDIYLLRFESQDLASRLLRPNDPQRKSLDRRRGSIPVAYHLDLRGASGYFISQSVQMRDKDVLLITNAESVQVSKMLAVIRTMAGIYYDIAVPLKSNTSASSLNASTADQTTTATAQ